MEKAFALCVLFAVAHLTAGAALKDEERKALAAKRYSHLQVEIDEWKRLGKPLEMTFHHTGNITAPALLTELPTNSPSLFKTDFAGNIFYYLYTRNNPDGNLVSMDVAELTAADWSTDRHTKIVIHGFGNNIKSQIFKTLVPALLANGDYNVIAVDWGKLCPQPWYLDARANVKGTGEQVAKLVDFLVSNQLLQLTDLHVLGHSLGAHVAGNVGKHVSSGDVQRITGMDPALPLFLVLKADRLHKNDAVTVDVVHTCANFVGLEEAVGDVDFYPNGGEHPQPGCGADLLGSCSHGRSYELVAESGWEKNAFPAVLCPSKDDATKGACDGSEATANMGIDLKFDAPGTYYLLTADSKPYDLATHKKAAEGEQ